jgi:hypothetical protein
MSLLICSPMDDPPFATVDVVELELELPQAASRTAAPAPPVNDKKALLPSTG